MIATRPPGHVAHVHTSVANPTACPSSARDDLHPLALGIGDQRARDPYELAVASLDAVERAGGVHRREQFGQVRLGHAPAHHEERVRRGSAPPAA
ncbi:MAG TPA: hypothetical protein VFZ00_15855 [Solirubrobacter sp.]|nr:hypothetical protein [Solirubrobacter sp.]